jgi:asparagine synthase (glutamine-hydrolysing)
MHGIVSKQQLDQGSLNGLFPLLFPLPWVALGGGELYDDEALSVVADAVLYNFRELCRGEGYEAESCARLIAALYARHGLGALEKLDGVFCLCIVDKKSRKVIVATDRFGIKPVVYSADGQTLIFGSRIKTVLSIHQAPPPELDYEAVVDYLNLSAIPTPKTIYKKVKKLPPGHFLVLEKGSVLPEMRRYYDIDYRSGASREDYYVNKLPGSIGESVKGMVDHELASGNKVGAFLSGGTDSSTITGMIGKLTGSVKAFSIGFDEPGYNELDYARIAARHFGAEHHEYMVTPDDVLKALDVIVDGYDEPFGNASAVPTYFCARLAREHGVDTLFAGDGGDEIFGGNERYAADKVFSAYHKIPALLRRGLVEPLVRIAPSAFPVVEKGKKYIRRANIPHPDRFFSYNPVIALGKEAIFSPDFLGHVNGYDPVAWARELYDRANGTDELNRLLYIDMKFTITDNDLRKVTTMSEMAGIRVAYPFLDHHVVDFAAGIPADLKVKGRYLRYIFKKALNDFLPREIIDKRKHGFGLPIGVWIRSNKRIASLAKDTLLSANPAIKPFFRNRFIEELFTMHQNTSSAFYGDIIWLLLVLELWAKKRSNS